MTGCETKCTWLKRKGFFDLGGEFQSERVETLSKIANVLEKMVVGNQRWDGGEKPGGGGDEGFGNTGSNGAKAGSAGGAETGEGVDDTPDGSEQTDEGGHAGGGGEPRHAFFHAADFIGGGELHADRDGLKRFDLWMRIIAFTGDLRLKFAITGGVNVGKGRAGRDDPLRIGDALGSTKYSQELV